MDSAGPGEATLGIVEAAVSDAFTATLPLIGEQSRADALRSVAARLLERARELESAAPMADPRASAEPNREPASTNGAAAPPSAALGARPAPTGAAGFVVHNPEGRPAAGSTDDDGARYTGPGPEVSFVLTADLKATERRSSIRRRSDAPELYPSDEPPEQALQLKELPPELKAHLQPIDVDDSGTVEWEEFL
eukprot:786416-Prymnesium_polylepis.1